MLMLRLRPTNRPSAERTSTPASTSRLADWCALSLTLPVLAHSPVSMEIPVPIPHEITGAFECGDVIRRAHVSRKREQQATAPIDHRWVASPPLQTDGV